MRQTTKLQIPLNTSLRLRSEKQAKAYGYSSLQEVVRVFLTSFADNKVHPAFVSEAAEVLSSAQNVHILNRIEEVREAIEKKDAYTATSGEEIIKQARSVK